MIIDLSKLKPAVVPVVWSKLDAIVLKNERDVLIIRTPTDNAEELALVAKTIGEIIESTPYLVVPYSVEFLRFQVQERWWRRMWRKTAEIFHKFIDTIRRAVTEEE